MSANRLAVAGNRANQSAEARSEHFEREVVQTRVDVSPDTPHPRHKHPDEEVIYVLEGLLEYHINGEQPRVFSAGEALRVPAETVHAVPNVGTGTAAELDTHVVERGSS